MPSLFPNQHEVYQYLSNYIEQSLPKEIFRFNTEVINITYSNDKWIVQSRTKSNEICSEEFDFVIVASGFFDSPYIPDDSQQSSKIADADDEKPAFVAISDMYAEWTRAKKIVLKQGRLVRVDDNGRLILNNGMTIETNENDILILCTGYRPCLDFFSPDILKELSHQAEDLFCPIILHRSIFHPSLPNLAFIGMYRGPFWTIIELQSRWIASIFAGLSSVPSLAIQQQGLEIEHQIRVQQPRTQFPHGDFVGSAHDLAKEVFGSTFSNLSDIVIASQFQSNGPDPAVMAELNTLCEESSNGRFVAGAVFRALHESKWTFERRLTGKPSDGIAHGQAQFLYSNSEELLYKEQGKLILSSGNPLDITQKYLYVYNASDDLLQVYFVDEHNQRTSLFHTIHFQPKETSSFGWIAHGEHLCGQDHYSTSYLFVFNGIDLSRVEITYTVKGPAKDYISQTIFQAEKV